MQWILIITVILVAILVLLRRKKNRPTITNLSDDQLDSMSSQVRSKIDHLDNKREDGVTNITTTKTQSDTVPLSVIIERLERYKLENRDNEVTVKDINHKIACLKENYRDEIPIEAVYEIAKEVMR